MSRLCLGLAEFGGGGLPSIGCGCACFLNGALENDTNLPKILLACATPHCNLVCYLSESIELSVDFVRDV